MKIHLCNPIGLSMGCPENGIPRLSAFLKSKGYQVDVADLRIKVLAKLKEFNLSPDIFIEDQCDDIASEYRFLPRHIRVLQQKNQGLLYQYQREKYLSRTESFLFALAQLNSPGLFNGRYDGKNIPERINISDIKRAVDEEIGIWLNRIAAEKFDLIGFSILPRRYYELLENRDDSFRNHRLVEVYWCIILAGMVKRVLNVPVWVGYNVQRGYVYPLAHWIFKLGAAIDFFIFDDYEETLLEYIERLERKTDTFSVPGTIVKSKGQAVCNPPRGLIKPLDKLPFSDYSGIPLDLYQEVFGRRQISIQGSMGCPERCSFCSPAAYRQEYIRRSPEHIAGEMIHLNKEYGVKPFLFNDRLINVNIEELERFCDLLIASGLDLYWGGYAKISPLMTKRLLEKMYAGGCRYLFYGVESGSPEILRRMKKQFTLDEVSRILQDTFHNNISTMVQIMTDFPGETEKELGETIEFIKKNYSFIVGLRVNSLSLPRSSLARGRKMVEKNQLWGNKNVLKLIEAAEKIDKSRRNSKGKKYLYDTKTKRLVNINRIRSQGLKFLVKVFLSLIKKRNLPLS